MPSPRFRRKIEAAKAWLRTALEDEQPHSAIDLIIDAEQVGIARRTLQLAGEEMVKAGEMQRTMQYKPERRWLWQRTIEQEVLGK